MLEELGYHVQVLEFIDMEHTPKNILIRAVKGAEPKEARKEKQSEGAAAELQACMEFLHVNPTLAGLLEEK